MYSVFFLSIYHYVLRGKFCNKLFKLSYAWQGYFVDIVIHLSCLTATYNCIRLHVNINSL